MYRKLFAFFLLLAISSTSFAQLAHSGVFALIGFSEQELVFISDEATSQITSISSLAETASLIRMFDDTLYVVNGDDYMTGQGSGLWYAAMNEIRAAVSENRDVNWGVKDLPDNTNPYDIVKAGRYLFVSFQQANSIAVLDLDNDMEPIGTFEDISYPQGMAFNGEFVAVAESGLGSGSRVMLIDPENLGVAPSWINVGTNPQWLDVDSEGNFYTVCTGNYVDVFGSAWKLDMSGEAVTTSSLDLGGSPSSIKIITDNLGNEVAYAGDEYAYETPCFYAWNCSDMSSKETGLGGISGGWCLAGDGNTLYYGSSMYNTLGAYPLDGFSQPSTMATLNKEVSSILFWRGETNNIDPTDMVSTLPETAHLLSTWPNPFNAATTVKISLNSGAGGELMVVNTLGQIVKNISLDGFTPGEHQISINGNDMTSGTYFLMLNTANGTDTRKITLVK